MNVTILDSSGSEVAMQWCFAVYGIISIPICSLLLYLICTKSPPSFADYRIILFNCTLNHLMISIGAIFIQNRSLPTPTSLALLPIGPCKWISPEVCFIAYNVSNFLKISGVCATALAMHFRYSLIHDSSVTRDTLIRNMILVNIVPISMLITPHLAPFEFEKVMSSAVAAYPEYDLLSYGPFGGFKSTEDPIFQMNTMFLLIGAWFLPIVILYWRWRILRHFKTNSNSYSETTMKSSRMLVKALTYQTLMPIFCYIPLISHYVLQSRVRYRSPFSEYVPGLTYALPSIFDSLLTIHFVAPYRIWVRRTLRNEKTVSQITQNPSSVIAPVVD